MPDGAPWPKLSVVTPTRNQAAYLEETLRSVMLQGYPNLEYTVIDGSSTDETPRILSAYVPVLSRFVREPDSGQSDAIIKGFASTSGTLVSWLNSDDFYLPGALAAAALRHAQQPDAIIAGDVVHWEGTGRRLRVRQYGLTLENVIRYWEGKARWQQPGQFYPRAAYTRAGGLDPTLAYAMDYDLLCRLLRSSIGVDYLDAEVAVFRHHPASKTCTHAVDMLLETSAVSRRYWHLLSDDPRARHDAALARALAAIAAAEGRRGCVPRAIRLALQAVVTAASAIIHRAFAPLRRRSRPSRP
jgi:glycosyltransferase involved in cell wall biosynthesis